MQKQRDLFLYLAKLHLHYSLKKKYWNIHIKRTSWVISRFHLTPVLYTLRARFILYLHNKPNTCVLHHTQCNCLTAYWNIWHTFLITQCDRSGTTFDVLSSICSLVIAVHLELNFSNTYSLKRVLVNPFTNTLWYIWNMMTRKSLLLYFAVKI